ncbi:hypothetical protein [Paraburkholderia silvatlantica]|uniref:hypothetical protein n=1 Tax=Paraburkholderia silvatlantica TaxID=321895 RepID=UPI0037503088
MSSALVAAVGTTPSGSAGPVFGIEHTLASTEYRPAHQAMAVQRRQASPPSRGGVRRITNRSPNEIGQLTAGKPAQSEIKRPGQWTNTEAGDSPTSRANSSNPVDPEAPHVEHGAKGDAGGCEQPARFFRDKHYHEYTVYASGIFDS